MISTIRPNAATMAGILPILPFRTATTAANTTAGIRTSQ
jgi:hypothetical protein